MTASSAKSPSTIVASAIFAYVTALLANPVIPVKAAPDPENEVAVAVAGKVTFPELSPEIQVVSVELSHPAITNCLEPVADPASTFQIITFPAHVVRLSPASCPIQIL